MEGIEHARRRFLEPGPFGPGSRRGADDHLPTGKRRQHRLEILANDRGQDIVAVVIEERLGCVVSRDFRGDPNRVGFAACPAKPWLSSERDGYFSDAAIAAVCNYRIRIGAAHARTLAHYTFDGWKRSGVGDHNQHGTDSIRFYTHTKTVTALALRPLGGAETPSRR